MDVSDLKQVVKLFIQDVDEELVQFDNNVAALEKEGASQLLLEKLARTIHSVKGSAAALGFAEIAEFSHHVERYLKALKTHEQLPRNEICKPLLDAKKLIHEHVQSLRENKRPPSGGEKIIQAMEKVLEPKPFAHIVRLPRAPLAGDIWLMNDEFKLELFEFTEEPQTTPDSGAGKLTDPEQYAIQSEILRLTQLAAAVNLNTVLAAQSRAVQDNRTASTPEWSLAGLNVSIISEDSETSDHVSPDSHELGMSHDDEISSGTDSLVARVLENPAASATDAQVLNVVTDSNTQHEERTTHSAIEPEANTDSSELPSCDISLYSAAGDGDSLHSTLQVEANDIRVSLKDIDALLGYTEELVTLQNILDEHKPVFETPLLQKTISRLSKLIAMTQELSMSMKMVLFGSLTKVLSSHTQTLADAFQKTIHTEIVGGDTEIDKSILDSVATPISLLISNAVEHGIETPEERIAKGKPAGGRISVSMKMKPKEIIFEVSDDGRGLDIPQIRKKAIACGLMTRLDRMNDEHIRSFIFHPGFSTRSSTQEDDEGQGLGLGQISTFARTHRGRVEIDSIKDHGTVFRLILPQSVSVIEALVVKVGSERFIIPKDQIKETVSSQEAQVDVIQGHHQLLNLRGVSVPLIQLSTVLRRPTDTPKAEATYAGIALVAQEEQARPFAVIVDDVICQKKVVIKHLGEELQGLRGLTGAAILGDGKPSIILDLHELISSYRSGKTAGIERKSA